MNYLNIYRGLNPEFNKFAGGGGVSAPWRTVAYTSPHTPSIPSVSDSFSPEALYMAASLIPEERRPNIGMKKEDYINYIAGLMNEGIITPEMIALANRLSPELQEEFLRLIDDPSRYWLERGLLEVEDAPNPHYYGRESEYAQKVPLWESQYDFKQNEHPEALVPFLSSGMFSPEHMISPLSSYGSNAPEEPETSAFIPTNNDNLLEPAATVNVGLNNNPNLVLRSDSTNTDTASIVPPTQIATQTKALAEATKSRKQNNANNKLEEQSATKQKPWEIAIGEKDDDVVDFNDLGQKTYEVKKGDSPWEIATRAGISLETFYKLNPGTEENGVFIGDKVNLTLPKEANLDIYQIQRGDSPAQIAYNNGMTLEEFYKLNPEYNPELGNLRMYPYENGYRYGDVLVRSNNRSNSNAYGGYINPNVDLPVFPPLYYYPSRNEAMINNFFDNYAY